MPVEAALPLLHEQGSDSKFFDLLSGWGRIKGGAPSVFGLAVSGGSDSMAMLHLMAQAATDQGWSLRAVTVDHGLRAEAAKEAAFVARVCADLGVPHDTLVWNHGAIDGNVMQAAGTARYGLMAGWAQQKNIGVVALAHTADDQAETFLMGLSRSAGLDGLSGMRREFKLNGVTFVRPFLPQTREALRSYLREIGAVWVEDPTNENEQYLRVKARKAMSALAPLGITTEQLSTVIENLAASREALHGFAVNHAKQIIHEGAGALWFDREAFLSLHFEMRRRLLIAMLLWLNRERHSPREAKISAMLHALDQHKDATLAGVRFRWNGKTCTVTRELRACGPAVPAGQLWDGRWQVTGQGAEVRALGAEGLRQCPDWRQSGWSRQVLEVTPGLWNGDQLVAAPFAGVGAATATLTASFSLFLLSH